MKRIFIVDEHISSKQNGVGTYMRCLLAALSPLDVSLNLLSFNAEERQFTIHHEGRVTHYCFPVCFNGKFVETGELSWPVFKLYVEDSAENVFFVNHTPCADFLKCLRRLYRKSRIIFTIHDQGWTEPLLGNTDSLRRILTRQRLTKAEREQAIYVRTYCGLERKMYRIADDIVCLSSATLCLLQELYGVPGHKIHLIPNGLDLNVRPASASLQADIRLSLGLSPDERIMVFVGRTVRAKGIYELCKAFDRVSQADRKLRLVIIGKVNDANTMLELLPHSAPHVTLTGQIGHDMLQQWYQVAEIGLLPSYSEQCSYAGIEMMAHGLLVLTTDGNGLRDMFTHRVNALVAPLAGDFTENLTQCLKTALSLSSSERETICRKGLEIANSRYSLASMTRAYEKLLFGD